MSRTAYNIGQFDETSSVQSYKGSIFDGNGYTLSSASSFGEDTHVGFVGAFLDLLTRDPSVDRMLTRATSDSGVGTERFSRNFSKILKRYSRDLRDKMLLQEKKDEKQRPVVGFILHKSTQTSSLLTTRYRERAPRASESGIEKAIQYSEDPDSDSNHSSDGEDQDAEITIEGLEAFLMAGEPFRALKWHLRSLIIPDQSLYIVKRSTDHLVELLSTQCLLDSALSKAPGINAAFGSALKFFIADLASEARAEGQLLMFMADYLETYSRYIEARALETIGSSSSFANEGNRVPHAEFAGGNVVPMVGPGAPQLKAQRYRRETSQDVLEDIVAEKLPGVFDGGFARPNFWPFLKSTQAYRAFVARIRDPIFPTFISEARKYLLESHIADDVERDPGVVPGLEERRVVSILKEIEWCLPRNGIVSFFKIETFQGVGLFDRLKLAVEHSTGSRWDWWPLRSPARLSLDDDRSRRYNAPALISWTCKCGTTRREAIYHPHADKIRQLADQYPVMHFDPAAIALDRVTKSPMPSNKSSGGSPPSSADTRHGSISVSGDDGTASTKTAPSSTGSVVVNIGGNVQGFVSLLVYRSSRFVLASIDITEKDAREFFRDIVTRYQQEKGVLRRIFSIFVYSHCDFVKVRHEDSSVSAASPDHCFVSISHTPEQNRSPVPLSRSQTMLFQIASLELPIWTCVPRPDVTLNR